MLQTPGPPVGSNFLPPPPTTKNGRVSLRLPLKAAKERVASLKSRERRGGFPEKNAKKGYHPEKRRAHFSASRGAISPCSACAALRRGSMPQTVRTAPKRPNNSGVFRVAWKGDTHHLSRPGGCSLFQEPRFDWSPGFRLPVAH